MQADIVTAYGLLARLHRDNNRLDAARTVGIQALAIAQTQAAANPGDAAWQHFHLLSHAALGRIALLSHDVPAARRSSAAALKIAQREAASHPDNSLWGEEQFKLWMTFGDIETEARRPQAARAAYSEALKKATTPENRQRANAQLSAVGRRRGR
jgi:predicted negative regulator of RcsB-dependent stress response